MGSYGTTFANSANMSYLGGLGADAYFYTSGTGQVVRAAIIGGYGRISSSGGATGQVENVAIMASVNTSLQSQAIGAFGVTESFVLGSENVALSNSAARASEHSGVIASDFIRLRGGQESVVMGVTYSALTFLDDLTNTVVMDKLRLGRGTARALRDQKATRCSGAARPSPLSADSGVSRRI